MTKRRRVSVRTTTLAQAKRLAKAGLEIIARVRRRGALKPR